ncbi:MAG: ATP-dependent 6-phosphofructokinase [Verrucomicrobiota bacterium]
MNKKRIGVLTTGGDCPGLNAVIRGVVRAAETLDWEIVGFREGFEGLLPDGGDYLMLNSQNTEGIAILGGTMLGTTNKGHFISKVGAGDKTQIKPEVLAKARKIVDSLGIEGLVVIGGDGSMTTAQQLFEAGFPVVGVPKSIDNDLEATARTFGFDSAVARVADALDCLHTTAKSHRRVMVIEAMGRHAGWIALHGGFAGNADIILIPEIPFHYEKVAECLRRREAQGNYSSLVVVAEGARAADGEKLMRPTETGEFKMGGIAEVVASEIAARTGKETRTCVLGHLQRGGTPSTLDRILGARFGVRAVDLIARQKFGHMVSYQNYFVRDVPILEAVHRLRLVTPDNEMVQSARAIGISFGD